MKAVAYAIKSIFANATSTRQDLYREWDRQRARALTPSDLAEIDAIFSRSL